jgi:stage II sporulation protein D
MPCAQPRRHTISSRLAILIVTVCLLALTASGASAASLFYVRGGGDGHGIGMSQYGADGYAQHGEGYQFILAHYYQGTALGQTSPTRTVRVLIADGAAAFSGATAAGGTALTASSTYTVAPGPGGRLQLSNATGGTVATVTPPLTVTGPSPLQVPGAGTYRGSLRFEPDGHGGVLTIDTVGLDDYVRGVVADEVPSGWPAAALEAQAVAARTYAITTSVGASAYDLYDDTRSQMYGGVTAETPSTNAAVGATTGQIVTYDGQPAVTYFFASSGGYTESIQNVWPGATPEPWLTGVPDPYDAAGGDPYHSWGSQMSLSAAQAKLGSLVRGSLTGIAITRHGVSPRILQAQVVGTRGTSTVSGAQLQGIFGLVTTYAAFTTITATASHGTLHGSLFPAPAHGSVTVQQLTAGGWHAIGHATVKSGRFSEPLTGPGRYRITYRSLGGPAVTEP